MSAGFEVSGNVETLECRTGSLVRDQWLIEKRRIGRWNGAGYWSGETLQWPSGTMAKEHWIAGWNIGLPTCCHIHDSHPDIELSIRPTGWNVTALGPRSDTVCTLCYLLDIATMLNTLLFCISVLYVALCNVISCFCCVSSVVLHSVYACLMGG